MYTLTLRDDSGPVMYYGFYHAPSFEEIWLYVNIWKATIWNLQSPDGSYISGH